MKRTQIGPYRIEGELGRGGMGVVYRAWDVAAQRPVALKFLVSTQLTGERRERFRREGELAARLDHPGIVRVLSAGTHQDVPYLTFEYVEGRPLGEAWAGASPEARVDWVAQIADALGHAHARGVVHRDVKPANVLIDAHGRARVLDFGLGLSADHDRLTRTGALLGTPDYMPPELFRGVEQRTHATPSADVWALGVLLYEALTGALPFTGHSWMELGDRVLSGRFTPPRALRPEVSAHHDAICRRALEVRPDDRYPDASSFAQALRGGDAHQGRPSTRRRALTAAVASVVLVTAGVVAGWPRATPPAPAPAAPPSPAPLDPWERAEEALERGDAVRAEAWLERVEPSAKASRWRGFAGLLRGDLEAARSLSGRDALWADLERARQEWERGWPTEASRFSGQDELFGRCEELAEALREVQSVWEGTAGPWSQALGARFDTTFAELWWNVPEGLRKDGVQLLSEAVVPVETWRLGPRVRIAAAAVLLEFEGWGAARARALLRPLDPPADDRYRRLWWAERTLAGLDACTAARAWDGPRWGFHPEATMEDRVALRWCTRQQVRASLECQTAWVEQDARGLATSFHHLRWFGEGRLALALASKWDGWAGASGDALALVHSYVAGGWAERAEEVLEPVRAAHGSAPEDAPDWWFAEAELCVLRRDWRGAERWLERGLNPTPRERAHIMDKGSYPVSLRRLWSAAELARLARGDALGAWCAGVRAQGRAPVWREDVFLHVGGWDRRGALVSWSR